MKHLFLFLLFIPLCASSQVSLAWTQPTSGFSIATDSNNNVYTVDYVYALGGDIILTKRDSDGNLVWETFYDNTDNTKFEVSTFVATDSQDNIIVTGTVKSGYSNPVTANSIAMKFDGSGNLLWRHVYETTFDGSYTKKCVVDAEDNVYVLGLGSGPSGLVTNVKKFNADGVAQWNYFDTAGIGAPMNIKLTPDQQLLIIGRGVVGNYNGYFKIDLNGNNTWNSAGNFSMTVGDADGDSVGNTYLVKGPDGGGEGTVMRKLSPTGAFIWENTYTLTAFRVEVGTDDQPVACGFPNTGSGGSSFVKVDANGDVVWYNLNADGVYNLLLHAQLLMDPFNNIYLAAGTLFEMAVCKVNSDGSNGWIMASTGGYAQGISLGTDNNIYVVGGNTAKYAQVPTNGCTDILACNYNPQASVNDGTCEYTSCICTGDLDGNNAVNTADLLIFFTTFGCLGECGVSDLNSDGIVNTGDLLLLVAVFGTVCE